MAAGVVAAEPVVVAEPVAGAVLAALAVLGAVAEDLVAEVALPGVPAERLERGPLGEQGLLAEWAAAVGHQPDPGHPVVGEVREPHPPRAVRVARMLAPSSTSSGPILPPARTSRRRLARTPCYRPRRHRAFGRPPSC